MFGGETHNLIAPCSAPLTDRILYHHTLQPTRSSLVTGTQIRGSSNRNKHKTWKFLLLGRDSNNQKALLPIQIAVIGFVSQLVYTSS
jgi:hypothetical protein